MDPSMWARPNRPKRVWDREERAQNRSTRARWAEENQAADAADQAADEEEQARGRSRLYGYLVQKRYFIKGAPQNNKLTHTSRTLRF